MRLLVIGGLLLFGTALVIVFLVVNTSDEPIGEVIPNAGQQHVDSAPPAGSYTSRPATSGPHLGTPANWGVYPGLLGTAVPEVQAIHNLEHGGIVIWYQEGQLDPASIDELASYVEGQLDTPQFKFILSPWAGEDFGHPIAVTAWTRLLYVDCAGAATSPTGSATATSPPAATPAGPCDIDIGLIRAFVDRYYQRLGPEPAGGPGPPA